MQVDLSSYIYIYSDPIGPLLHTAALSREEKIFNTQSSIIILGKFPTSSTAEQFRYYFIIKFQDNSIISGINL